MRLERVQKQAGRRLIHLALTSAARNGLQRVQTRFRDQRLVERALGEVCSNRNLVAVVATVSDRIDGREDPGDLVRSIVHGASEAKADGQLGCASSCDLDGISQVAALEADLRPLLDGESLGEPFHLGRIRVFVHIRILVDIAEGIVHFLYRVFPLSGGSHGLVKLHGYLVRLDPINVIAIVNAQAGGAEEWRVEALGLQALKVESMVLPVNGSRVFDLEGRRSNHVEREIGQVANTAVRRVGRPDLGLWAGHHICVPDWPLDF